MLRKCCVLSLVFIVVFISVLILPVNANATRADTCLATCQSLHSRGISLSVPCDERRLNKLLRDGYCKKVAPAGGGHHGGVAGGGDSNGLSPTESIVEPRDIITFGNFNAPGKHRDPYRAIDNNNRTKMLNFAKEGNGFTVTFREKVKVNVIEFTTANDDYGRDPTEVEILGSNISKQNGFKPIAKVPLTRPRARFAPYGSGFANGTAYKYYRVIITGIDRRDANSYQFAEVDFFSILDKAEVQGEKKKLFKCGEAQCVCRPRYKSITYDDKIVLPDGLHDAAELPVCATGVRPNGSIILGEKGYELAAPEDQRAINEMHESAKDIVAEFDNLRNKCDANAPFKQYCPVKGMLDDCFRLHKIPSPKEISPFEMGAWAGRAEKCAVAIPQCMAPMEVSAKKRIEMDKCYNEKIVDWRIAAHGPLAKLKEECGFPPEGTKITTTGSYKRYGPGSFSGCDAMSAGLCGVGQRLQRGEGADAITASLAKSGCEVFIPGCSFVTSATKGDAAGMALGAMTATVQTAKLLATAATNILGGAAAFIIDTTTEKCKRDHALQMEGNDKDNLSLEKFDPEQLKGMGENIKATGDFNDVYKKQEWSEDEDEKNKCRAIPATQQCTKMVGECLWLQWCKDFQRTDNAKITHTPKYVDPRPAEAQACLRVCKQFPPHLQNDSIRDGCSPAGLERLKNGFCGGSCIGC